MDDARNHAQGAAAASHGPGKPARTDDGAGPTDQFAARRRPESRRWWIALFVQPALLLSAGALLIVGLGAAQRAGWISAGASSGTAAHTAGQASDPNVRYICPMMCTPPQSEPGRCPVCAMELVASTTGGGGDASSISVDAAARRIAGIQTTAVRSMPCTRTIRTIGEIRYDEGSLTTISAYVDGRIDALYADYTGVVVKKGDHLALLYSPEIYAAEEELLHSRRALRQSEASSLDRVARSQRQLYEGARTKLLELGLTEQQLQQLERADKASFRIHLCAPLAGTVIEKLAEEGQYVKAGQPIYRLADLSTVWLMLELFPEDAAVIRYGQKVTAEVQSLPGKQFTGRVAFIDPVVNTKTRTVGVRVVFPNAQGSLRVGDYARATITAAIRPSGDAVDTIYDPELAGKWISPRHPHIIRCSPGRCPVCGVDLVPAERFGFVAEPTGQENVLVVPRSAVLMAGGNSVVYVEIEPGRFEIRKVLLGPCNSKRAVILKGVQQGEQVAVRGNFLLDSQMQLAGNPSLIDPTRLDDGEREESGQAAKCEAALGQLAPEDQALARQQAICPVTKLPLGSMGVPRKIDLMGLPIFLCCQGCEKRLREDPGTYLANLSESADDSADGATAANQAAAQGASDGEAAEIAEALSALAPADQALARAQRLCPVTDMPLGSMGPPVKVEIDQRIVFLCCEGCRESLLADKTKYLAKCRAARGADVSAEGAERPAPRQRGLRTGSNTHQGTSR